MKVIDLLDEINRCKKEYGDDFLNWDVYSEQIDPGDRKRKKSKKFGGDWETAKDGEGWEYFKCHGFWTKFPKERIFTVNVNY